MTIVSRIPLVCTSFIHAMINSVFLFSLSSLLLCDNVKTCLHFSLSQQKLYNNERVKILVIYIQRQKGLEKREREHIFALIHIFIIIYYFHLILTWTVDCDTALEPIHLFHTVSLFLYIIFVISCVCGLKWKSFIYCKVQYLIRSVLLDKKRI